MSLAPMTSTTSASSWSPGSDIGALVQSSARGLARKWKRPADCSSVLADDDATHWLSPEKKLSTGPNQFLRLTQPQGAEEEGSRRPTHRLSATDAASRHDAT